MRSIQIPRVPSWKDDSIYTLNVSGRFTPDFSRWQHLSCKLHKPWRFNSWFIKISWRSLGTCRKKKVTKNGQNKKLFQASKEDMPSIQNFVRVSDAPLKPPDTLLPVPGGTPGFTGLVVLIMLSPWSLQTWVGIRLLTAGVGNPFHGPTPSVKWSSQIK